MPQDETVHYRGTSRASEVPLYPRLDVVHPAAPQVCLRILVYLVIYDSG